MTNIVWVGRLYTNEFCYCSHSSTCDTEAQSNSEYFNFFNEATD